MSDQETFGPYRITKQLADGPIARVCRAVHTVTGQSVLLRIVHPLASRNKRLQAILEDLRDPHSPRRIDDPSVLNILRVGKAEERYYVAFEDFSGVTLESFLREERPTMREGLDLAIQIAASLRAIHARRIPHGDIKPQNILVAQTRHHRPVVKMAMADLAHSAPEAMISICGEIVGTPKYMSPEQIQGKRPTPASDIFSLGIIFYELFSGREPFPGDNPLAYMHANAEVEPKPLAMVETTAPMELDRIVMRMLQKNPAHRYRRADQLLDDLEHVEARLEGHAIDQIPAGTDSVFATPPPSPKSGSWRSVAVASMVVTALLLGAMLTLLAERFWKRSPGQAPSQDIEQVSTTSGRPRPKPETRQPDGEPVRRSDPSPDDEFANALNKARQAVHTGKPDVAAKQLETLKARFLHPTEQQILNSEIAAALFAHGQALVEQNRDDKALSVFTKVARRYQGTPSAAQATARGIALLSGRVNLHKSRGDLQAATSALKELIAEFPSSEAARAAVGELPRMQARYADAMLATDPDKAIELFRLSLGRAAAQDEVAVRKKLAAALLHRAEKNLRQKKFAETARDINELKVLDPDNRNVLKKIEPELLYHQASALKAKNDFEGALSVWKKLRQNYGTNIWQARGMKEMASLEKLVGAGPGTNADILFRMAEQSRRSGDLKTARQRFQAVLQGFPNTEQATKAAGLLSAWDLADAMEHWHTGRREQAIALLKAITEKYAAMPEAARAALELQQLAATPENMVYVPGGEFVMGLDPVKARQLAPDLVKPLFDREVGPQIMGRSVLVAGFYIDRCEVTNAQYKKFIGATNVPAPRCPAWNLDTKEIRKGFENYPVTNVTWNDAAAYAKWAGKRLPTEAEWEKAARGADGRLFPWGNEFVASNAITLARRPLPKSPAPVGSAPAGASPYGAEDMIGNVQEWTQDFYHPYPTGKNPTTPEEDNERAIRGAGWNDRERFSFLCTSRWQAPADLDDTALGFRCAKDAP